MAKTNPRTKSPLEFTMGAPGPATAIEPGFRRLSNTRPVHALIIATRGLGCPCRARGRGGDGGRACAPSSGRCLAGASTTCRIVRRCGSLVHINRRLGLPSRKHLCCAAPTVNCRGCCLRLPSVVGVGCSCRSRCLPTPTCHWGTCLSQL